MKKYYCFLFIFAWLASSCDWFEDDVVYPLGEFDAGVDASWSDDLLKFVTPVLSYTDVNGLHEIVVDDAKTVDDILVSKGDTIYGQSWDYNFTYDYAEGDSVALLKLRYVKKDHAEIVDTAAYAFEHDFNISRVSMWYINDEGKYSLASKYFVSIDINISIGEKDSLDEPRYRGAEAKQFIDSLIAHPLEREIIFRNGVIVVFK